MLWYKDRASLPIFKYRDTIINMVKKNQVILVAGDTGCGKSTQVAQYLMEAGFDKIACTQPRKIACFSLAKRVSYETMNTHGSEIAYQVRFEGNKSRRTRILFLTEGLLLRQYASDSELSMYNVIIVDEVHERGVTIDFLLTVIKSLCQLRTDIRIVLMSATINAELFSNYFGGCPIIEVPGKMYEVAIHYVPFEKEDRDLLDVELFKQRMETGVKISIPSKLSKVNSEPYLKIMEKIDQSISPTERGDLLIFMSGINEISTLADELRIYANYTKRWIILPLHSSLSEAEQEKIFDIAPEGVRKCIISTNIAETSVTIDGIRFIIDSGKVKEMHYDHSTHLNKLSEFWISKGRLSCNFLLLFYALEVINHLNIASAKQRAGRAGRTGPGECYRLYSRAEFKHLNDFPIPEVLRVSLESVILNIKALGLGDPRELDFIERPPLQNIEMSIQRLRELGAVEGIKEKLTPLGKALSQLPVDASLGKMLILGSIFNVTEPILIVAAGLSVSNSLFLRVPESKPEILDNQRSFFSHYGDPLTLLNVYNEWIKVKAARQESSRKWCMRHGIEEQRLYEMTKLKRQFEDILSDFRGYRIDRMGDTNEVISTLLSCLFRDRERKRKLRMLNRQRQLQSSKKRKILKFQDVETEESTHQEEGNVCLSRSCSANRLPRFCVDVDSMDIRDLEFSISHDVNRLQQQTESMLESMDLNLLRFIICSGLYPQLAITDELNPKRKLQDWVFHTKNMRFVTIHPTSVFYAKSELLEVKPTGIDELICYLQLLETTKPYLMNLIRVPAVHTCLMFAKSGAHHLESIAPNVGLYFEQEIVGNWSCKLLTLCYESTDQPFMHLSKQSGLGLQTQNEPDDNEGTNLDSVDFIPPAIKKVYKDARSGTFDTSVDTIVEKLTNFLNMSLPCRIEVLKDSDIAACFAPEDSTAEILEAEQWAAGKSKKQGIQITSYLRYKSVSTSKLSESVSKASFTDFMRTYWKCGNCQGEFMFNKSEVLNHLQGCLKADDIQNKVTMDDEEETNIGAMSQSGPSVGAKEYQCKDCGQTLMLTPIEILKHRKSHKN
ncbi:P-loop containing nucleoside triphosphate hydrolase protein [Paraphysoderma sedebokerense]|nr:P-loop containing nucleoside triphosphate hydrolase protein [Paraphysoderma sedebokerense]